MGIKGIDHIVVRVKDIDEGVKTYRDKLGMEMERTSESEALGIVEPFDGSGLAFCHGVLSFHDSMTLVQGAPITSVGIYT